MAKRYKWRRPNPDEPYESRYEWIADTDAGWRIAVNRRPGGHPKWRGFIMDGSLYIKEKKADTRNAVAEWLISTYGG